MSDILEKITSSNIIFFSIIGILVLIIIVMIILIRKENKNKLNDILDQSRAIKVLDEKEITDTVAIPNINIEMNNEDNNLNSDDVITIPNLDVNLNNELDNVNDVNLDIQSNVDINSGATINDTISLPKVEDDEEIQPIVNPFDINIESQDLKTLDEIDNFTKEIELPTLKEDYNDMIVSNFELPSLKEEFNEVDVPLQPVNLLPEVNVPVIEPVTLLPKEQIDEVGEGIEQPEIELPEIELPKEYVEIELPKIVEEEKDFPVIDLPLVEEEENIFDVDLPVEVPATLENVDIDISLNSDEEEQIEEDVTPVIMPEETNLPFVSYKDNEDDDEDGKYEYDEDLDEDVEGVPLSELTEGEVTDDNLAELAIKLEERVLPDVVKLTSYEEEQEEDAIISYDELLSKTDALSIEKNEREMETQAIDIRDINNQNDYSYEEDFLSTLKDLRDSLK